MQNRPVFMINGVKNVDFALSYNFGRVDYRSSSLQLRQNAKNVLGVSKILEVSSASEIDLGRNLSAFNLKIRTRNGQDFSVEQLFQSAKVFKNAGAQTTLLNVSARDAKVATSKLHRSGDSLVGFELFGKKFPMNPTNAFYDWLYLHALHASPYRNQVLQFDAFTDIRFNPNFSINCQAMACAKYCFLVQNNRLDCLNDFKAFVRLEDCFEKTLFRL